MGSNSWGHAQHSLAACCPLTFCHAATFGSFKACSCTPHVQALLQLFLPTTGNLSFNLLLLFLHTHLLQANCWRGHEMLHEQFANRTLDAMRKYNMTTLFVMTHPFIRDFITDKLKEVRGHA